MWQRFSAAARRVVLDAQGHMRSLGGNVVEPEALLRAAISQPECMATAILGAIDADAEGLIVYLDRHIVAKAQGQQGEFLLTPASKRAIDKAYEEARTLGSRVIGTDHLLLGLLQSCPALNHGVLVAHRIDLQRIRGISTTTARPRNE